MFQTHVQQYQTGFQGLPLLKTQVIMLGRRFLGQAFVTLKSVYRPVNSLTSTVARGISSPSSAPKTSSQVTPPSPAGLVIQQAPNYPTTWSTSQRQRPAAGEGPRFEQTNMELQPAPLSAMVLVNNEPIRFVEGRKVVCDGGRCFLLRLGYRSI